jgi:hypothetical protein
MIRNIEDFPRLNVYQKLENSKLTIQMCDEGIDEMTDAIVALVMELERTPFELEKREIMTNIRYFEEYISSLVTSKMQLQSAVNQLSYVFN